MKVLRSIIERVDIDAVQESKSRERGGQNGRESLKKGK